MPRHSERKTGAGFAPDAIAAAGADPKTVFTRRDVIVKRRPPDPGLDPIGIQTFQPVTKPHLLGQVETHRRVLKFKPMAARRDAQPLRGRQGPAARWRRYFGSQDGI